MSMKKPNVSRKTSEPTLAGTGNTSSWIKGYNGIYQTESPYQYRVAVNTPEGWRSYGFFHDLQVASYVANIAILNENCVTEYQLNAVGEKNQGELSQWRNQLENREAESKAKVAFSLIQEALKDLHENERILEEKVAAQTKREKESREAAKIKRENRLRENATREDELIKKSSRATLLELLHRDLNGEQYRKIRTELNKRVPSNG